MSPFKIVTATVPTFSVGFFHASTSQVNLDYFVINHPVRFRCRCRHISYPCRRWVAKSSLTFLSFLRSDFLPVFRLLRQMGVSHV